MRPGALLLAAAVLLAGAACRAAREEPPALTFEYAAEFEGEQAVAEERLAAVVRAELARLEVERLDRAAVDDAAFALELFYRSLGHARVQVDYELVEREGSAPLARFTIDEGPALRVRELVLEGGTAFSSAVLLDQFGPAAHGGAYDAERIETGRQALREYYLDRAYLLVEVGEARADFHEDDTVSVAIALREGPEFRLREIRITGGAPELAEREKRLAHQYTDGQFLVKNRRKIESALLEDYRRHGHPDVEVELDPTLDEATGDVRLAVHVVPGERVTIAHFRIQGNARTRDSAILSTLGIELGERYDSERLRAAFRELYATGLFESVELALEGSGPERTLVITVAEARSVQIRLEPGWGSYEGPRVLLGIEENNFMGRGQVVALQGTASLLAQTARVGWIDRTLAGSAFTSELTFFVERREEPSFEYVRRGFGYFLRRRLGPDWSASAGFEFRPTNVVDDDLPLPTDIDDDTDVAALSAALVLDDRDNLLLPTRGRRGRLSLEWADDGLGSDTEFVRGQFEYTHLFRLGSEGVLAAAARTGVIAPFGSTDDVPLTERFFNGGENSVRSFREDELGPQDLSGDPLGGETTTTLNLEARRSISGNLAGALFVDTGNVAVDAGDYLDFPDFRSGVGLGLRYLLPIGPVRLDLAVNPDPEDGEDEYVLHFSVGFPF